MTYLQDNTCITSSSCAQIDFQTEYFIDQVYVYATLLGCQLRCLFAPENTTFSHLYKHLYVHVYMGQKLKVTSESI